MYSHQAVLLADARDESNTSSLAIPTPFVSDISIVAMFPTLGRHFASAVKVARHGYPESPAAA
jgi:hypothetical protein